MDLSMALGQERFCVWKFKKKICLNYYIRILYFKNNMYNEFKLKIVKKIKYGFKISDIFGIYLFFKTKLPVYFKKN